jgi:hypothetical protein
MELILYRGSFIIHLTEVGMNQVKPTSRDGEIIYARYGQISRTSSGFSIEGGPGGGRYPLPFDCILKIVDGSDESTILWQNCDY